MRKLVTRFCILLGLFTALAALRQCARSVLRCLPGSRVYYPSSPSKTKPLQCVLLMLFMLGWASAVQAAIPAAERAVLDNLYASTNGAGWTNKTGWGGASGTECTWYGITCDGAQSHVTIIGLQSNHLVGTLPSLGGLTALQDFRGGSNQLSGSIPSLNGLTALSNFQVWGNQLTGSIPSLSGLTALKYFFAWSNQLTGSIPSLSGSTALLQFSVNLNLLSGPIPAAPNSLDVGGSYLCGNSLVSSGNTAIDAAWTTATGSNWLACQTAPPSCTLTATPASIAAGGTSTLTASCTNTPTSYTWTGGTCAGNATNTCTVTPSATTTYTVTGVNASGSGTAASAAVSLISTASPTVAVAKFAYVANRSSGTVSVYTVNPTTGALTAGTAVVAGLLPSSVTVDPSGKFAYVANQHSNNVSVYTIDQTTGALTAGTAVAAGTDPVLVTVDPSGRFAYVANQGSNNISVYTIDQTTGALTTGTAVTAGSVPMSITVDPTGKFAYVANFNSNNISVYMINPTTGALTAGTAVAAGTSPRSVTVDPSGRFAYTANYSADNISVYTINPTTGALTAGTAVVAGRETMSVTTDSSGKFVYVTVAGSNNVSVYTIDPVTGALTARSTVATGSAPIPVTVDPTGKFAYVANYGSNNISVYTIDQTTGALTAGAAVAAGTGPYSITTTAGATIAPLASQTITFGSAPTITVGGTGTVSATATSGLAVSFSSTTPGVCTVSGSTVTGVSAGTCTIAANQAGDASYNAATQVTQSITIDATVVTTFTDNGDGTVSDTVTGLMWQRCAKGQTWIGSTCSGNATMYNWDAAVAMTDGFAGYTDWRLPNITELQSLVKIGSIPTIDTMAFPNTPSAYFWSSSPDTSNDASNSYYAWGVHFYNGIASGGGLRSNLSYARLVRSGLSSQTRAPKFAYVANSGSNTVSVYTINPTTGALTAGTAVAAVAAGASPISVTVDPSGKFAYVANELSNNISVYTIDQTTGALTAGAAVAAGTNPRIVTVDASGKFAYVNNWTSNNISVYTINPATGALTAGTPVAAGTTPASVTIDPTGKFAYVANLTSGNVSVYTINPATGALTAGTPVAGGSAPYWVTVDPSGRFVYVANRDSNNISVYTINSATGALTAGTSVAAGITPLSVTVDPSGKFAYVANGNSNNISVYTINPTTGALTAGTAVVAGTNPASVTVDPSGKFAYVANFISNNISVFTINPTTGALTAGTAVAAGTAPYSVTTTAGYTGTAPAPSLASQTISFGVAPTVPVGSTGTATATATSGLPVTYSSLTASVCSVSGSTVTGITAGTCIIAAYQAGNASYNAALSRLLSIDVVAVANTAPTFSMADGKVTTIGASTAIGVVVQPNGKILVAGQNYGSSLDFALARYNSDGSLDASFGSDGKILTDIGTRDDYARSIALQTDGKILVAGSTYTGNIWNNFALVRYNTNGSLDTTFSGNGIVTTAVGARDSQGKAVTLQVDGKILVAGYVDSGGNTSGLVRYNTDGTLDTTFNGDGKVITNIAGGSSGDVFSIAVQADGKILLANDVWNGNNMDFILSRYNNDGSLDTSFNGGGKTTVDFSGRSDYAHSVFLLSGGKIMVAGGSSGNLALVRYNANGSLDTTFNGNGKLITSGANGNMAIMQLDGKILVAGGNTFGSSNPGFTLTRYNVDGSLDTTFDGGGVVTTAFGTNNNDHSYSVALQADGKIIVVGNTDSGGHFNLAMARYNTNGSLDTSFGGANTLNGTPTYTVAGAAVVLDSNVQIVDAELAASGNYAGATLTLVRNGGANAQDVFTNSGTLGTLTQGGNITVGGITIGTVTANSGGTLTLIFNSSATQTLVNSAMQQIAYRNSSSTPPASVQINWTFNDGNTGAQGTGGALAVGGYTSVSITVVTTSQTIGTISFNPTTLEVGGISTASATATSGLAVAYTSTTTGICTVSGSTVTGVTAGICTIAADQAGNATYDAATQVTQSITISAAAAPAISLNPTSLTFAAQNTGTSSAAQTVTLSNTGSAALSISSIAVSGDYARTTFCKNTLEAGASCTVSVTFTPTVSGARNGTLTITSNTAGGVNVASLNGVGGTPPTVALNLITGWNLLGNSSAAPIDVAVTFGDATQITTVWKWNKVASKWAFYAPSMAPSVLASYTQGKGYDVLASIDQKEGFWVNASKGASLTGPAANGVTLVETDLQQGWNLVGSADNKTPAQLHQGLSSSLNASGKSITTAWAWNAQNASWKFYAPALEAQGGTVLADYITTKGYLPFGAALSDSDGFWLNIGAVNGVNLIQ